jgi:ubiquinone/menaquinone biosynthesis C-methylase UbiE
LLLLSAIAIHPAFLRAQETYGWEAQQTRYQPPDEVIPAIGLKKGMQVGEIGAGRGRYTVILAEYVGDKGHIYANDIDEPALESRCRRDGIGNISIIRGEEKDPLLPENRLDMIFTVNCYHHFSDPVALLKNARPAGGRGGRGRLHLRPDRHRNGA